MTGLTRKEVKRLREIKSSGKRFEVQKAIAPASVLGNWFSDREFTDEDGKPRVLDFNGGKGTFTDLVKRFGGDVPAGAMRTELLRVGAIEELEGKKLKVLKSAFTPSNLDDRLAVALQLSLRRLGETILYNTDAKNREELRVERTIMTVPIMRDDLPSLRRVSAERLVEFANSMQDFFSDFEATHPTTEAEESLSVGVGIFYFEDSPDSSRL